MTYTGVFFAHLLDEPKDKVVVSPARQHYERIEPIAELFADLDASMDAREDDYEQGAKDPNFTGYHRLEKALWADNSTQDMQFHLRRQAGANAAELKTYLQVRLPTNESGWRALRC